MTFAWARALCEKHGVKEGLGPHSCCGNPMHAWVHEFEHEPEITWICLDCDNEIDTEERIQPREMIE